MSNAGILSVRTLLWLFALVGSLISLSVSTASDASSLRSPTDVAQHYLSKSVLTPDFPYQLAVLDVHDLGSGPIIVRFSPTFQGKPLINQQLSVVIDRSHNIIGHFGVPETWPVNERGGMTQEQAFDVVRSVDTSEGKQQQYSVDQGYIITDDKLVPTYRFAPQTVLDPTGNPSAVQTLVSAENGEILQRHEMVLRYQPYHYRVFADAMGHPLDDVFGNNQPHPTGAPDGFLPVVPAVPNLFSVAEMSTRTDDPWLPDDAIETIGNNVDVFFNSVITSEREFDHHGVTPASSSDYRPEDGDFRAQITSANTFDYSYNVDSAPYDYFQVAPTSPLSPVPAHDPQLNAKLVQAFYMANYLRDLFYDAGFDEAAGNAQHDNFGRGGVAGDRLKVYAGFHTTWVKTTPDGEPPIIHLGFHKYSDSRRDAGMDAILFAHEWAHYMVERLTGLIAAGGYQGQSGALHDGWADFISLLVAVREEHGFPLDAPLWGGSYSVGAYTNRDYNFPHSVVTGTAPIDTQYYGIRRYPYSVDTNRNPLSFKHIEHGAALPPNPLVSDWRGRSRYNAEVHSAGEVWASALWDCYANLLNDRHRLSFHAAKKRMLEYLVAGMKATPSDATMLDARNALLAVIRASDPQDYHLCRAGFAKRGMGAGAVGPLTNTSDNPGVIESKDSHEADASLINMRLVPNANQGDGDEILDYKEQGYIEFQVRNSGFLPLQVLVAKAYGSVDFKLLAQPEIEDPLLQPGADTLIRVPIELQNNQHFYNLQAAIKVAFRSTDGHHSFTRVYGAQQRTHYDLSRSVYIDDAQAALLTGMRDWSVERNESHPAYPGWEVVAEQSNDLNTIKDVATSNTAAARFQVAENFAGFSSGLVSPAISVDPNKTMLLVLRHRYAFDRINAQGQTVYKGQGRVQYSVDGSTWLDLESVAGPGYGVFSGQSNGYPQYTEEYFKLPTRGLAERQIYVRLFAEFTAHADRHYNGGWFIDAIGVSGTTSPPFVAIQPQRSSTRLKLVRNEP